MMFSFPAFSTTSSTTMSTAAFTLLTYNLFFSPLQWETRMRHILAECERRRPDAICFQEVLPQFLPLLTQQHPHLPSSWLERNGYIASTLDPQSLSPYSVLTLARASHHPTFRTVDLPTRMGRKLLLTRLQVGHQEDSSSSSSSSSSGWIIGNIHLESLDSAPLRKQQLEIAGATLRKEIEKKVDGGGAADNVILCGDFNFCSECNYDQSAAAAEQTLENDVLASALPDFQDLWPTLKPGGKAREGFTFDGTINELIEMPRPDPQMRYDRVLFKTSKSDERDSKDGEEEQRWRPTDIELLGRTPVILEEGDGSRRRSQFLSDHFGLLAHFSSKDKKNK